MQDEKYVNLFNCMSLNYLSQAFSITSHFSVGNTSAAATAAVAATAVISVY